MENFGSVNEALDFAIEREQEASDFYKWHLIGAHTFYKVRRIGPALEMAAVDVGRLNKRLKQSPDLVAYERIDNRLLLTASTAELQEFLKEHGDDEGLFGDFSDMKKAPANSGDEPEPPEQDEPNE